MTKKESKQKKAKQPSRWLLVAALVLVGAVVVTAILKSKKDRTDNAPMPTSAPAVIQTEARHFFVPPPVEFDIQFRAISSQPWVDRQRLLGALDLILSLHSSPELQTPHDRAIMRLAQEYKNGRKPFQTTYHQMVAIGSSPDAVVYGRLGHLCPEDQYGYEHIQSHSSILAISLYHELFHGAECADYLGERFDPNDPTKHEPGAYAAQVRMTLALYRAGYLNQLELSSEETSDNGVLQQTYEVWQALLANQFATWYKDQLANPDQLPQP